MPSLPPDLRIYAIGDIHGRADLLIAMLGRIERHAEQHPFQGEKRLVFLGDYVDRGPDSAGVLDMLDKGLPDGFGVDLLLGNHEQLMLDAFEEGGEKLMLWMLNGGNTTMQSFRDAGHEAGVLPARYMVLLKELKLRVAYGDYLFVHAGIRPGVPLDEQTRQDLLWIREPFLSDRDSFGWVVVHGHTPGEEPVIRKNRIGLDTGAWMTGRLTAALLEADSIEIFEVWK